MHQAIGDLSEMESATMMDNSIMFWTGASGTHRDITESPDGIGVMDTRRI